MEPKEFDLEFPRGDTIPVTFNLENINGENVGIVDEIYFTVKKGYNKEESIIQKRLSRGEITFKDGQYSLVLEHRDTANLSYGSYVYDIQIKINNYFRTVCIGKIILTNESTFISNE